MHIALLTLPGNFHAQKWARALQAAGAQVSIYSFEDTQLPDVRCVQLRARVRRRGRYHFLSYWWGGADLRRQLLADGIDVVHALHLTPFGIWGMHSGFRLLVAGALGADVLEYVPQAPAVAYGATRAQAGWLRALKRAWFGRQVRTVVHKARLVTADNRVLQLALQQHMGVSPQKLRLLPWGVADAIRKPDTGRVPAVFQHLGIPPGQRLILAPRGATAFYQADTILEAFARFLSQGTSPEHTCVLMSAGYAAAPPLAAQAEFLARQYPGRMVWVPAQLDAEDMGALWTQADVCISAPLYDGYSATVAEARVAGAVLLVNDIPAYRELLQPDVHARFVVPFSAENLTQWLQDTLAHLPAWQARLQPANRAWAAQHADMQPSAEAFLAWCAELVGNRM
ncbi:MAG: glycosyltransferase [Bacteroidetes bacterium]|nr:glycosyltransferase [Bacteroidota bacterium]